MMLINNITGYIIIFNWKTIKLIPKNKKYKKGYHNSIYTVLLHILYEKKIIP